MNAYKHGGYSEEARRELQTVAHCRRVLRICDKLKANLARLEDSAELGQRILFC